MWNLSMAERGWGLGWSLSGGIGIQLEIASGVGTVMS
jgi:hypothetical protein